MLCPYTYLWGNLLLIALLLEGVQESLGYLSLSVDKLLAGLNELDEYLEITKGSYTFGLALQDHMDVVAPALINIHLQIH